MSIVVSFGRWGGLYFYRGYTIRLCLGFFAITVFPADIDELLDELLKGGES